MSAAEAGVGIAMARMALVEDELKMVVWSHHLNPLMPTRGTT